MDKFFYHIKIFLTLSFFCLGADLFGQQEKVFETISMAQGLSQGMIFDIIQDEDGFLWIGTKNGLNRYDGYHFKVFTNDPYNDLSLSSNTISRLYEDSKGNIWVGTENAGVNLYDKKSGNFYRIVHETSNPSSLSGNGIKAIEEIAAGKMLIATDKAGLNIVNLPDEFMINQKKPTITRLILPGNSQVWGMGKDSKGNIWIGAMDGLVYRLDVENNRFNPWENAKLYYSGYLNPDGTVLINHHLYLDDGKEVLPLFDTKKIREGNLIFKPKKSLWDYFHREIYFYDISKWEKGKKIDWSEKPEIDKTKRISYPFLIDKSGILWSGSVGYGLRKYNIIRPLFETLSKGVTIRHIIPGKENDLFFVDYSYVWFYLKNGILQKNAFDHLKTVKQVDNMFISSKNEYWIKSDQGGYYCYNPKTKKLDSYPNINANLKLGKKQPFLEDSYGNIWLPGLNGTISLFHKDSGKLDSIQINTTGEKMLITTVFEEKKGVYWVGTENGFAKIKLVSDKISSAEITWLINDVKNRNSLSYNLISCFLPDPKSPDKYLWIATRGGGLNRLDKTTGDFFHLTKKDGLPDDVVYGILTDADGNIWGSTNKGVFCMTTTLKNQTPVYAFRYFTKSMGLQDDEFNTGAYAKLKDGRLAFGGVNGLNIFRPSEVLKSGFTPNVFITSLLVGNKQVLPNDKSGVLKSSVEYSQSITLHHEQDILTLEFSSLDFSAPDQNKYRYQLIGIDKDWVESGNRRSATFLHLPSGNYTFRVQGSNSQGIWSDKTTSLDIRVKPPWWMTWWACLIYIILLSYIIRSYLKFRVNKARLQSQLHYEQQEASRIKELDTVKTQLYANITHEFRTPLTVILGMANQIKNHPETYLENGVDMIVRNGQNLLNLVNQMLDLSKLESGKMTLHLTRGDIIGFLRYIVESFQSLAATDHKQFHFLPETDELLVAFDAEKIRQIITNLFSNALKFTPANGNVYVSVTKEESSDKSNVTLILKVKDTGIGIPENQLPYIFDRFYQTDNSQTRNAEGTGIGLALTKELVRLMSGTITVKSPPVGATKGTEFIISIPLQKVENVEAENIQLPSRKIKNADIFTNKTDEPTTTEKVKTNGSGPLILLVEDNADVVAYTVSCLPEYSLAVGNDGREGFDIAVEIVPDLIITDVMMPVIDGFEMCRKLRDDDRTSHIPIIMLTAKADMPSRLEGLKKGADVYLEKPFHKEELLLHITKLIDQRKNLREYYSRQMGLEQKTETLPDIEDAVLKEEKAEHEFVKKVREVVVANFSNYEFNVEQLCKMVFMSHSQLHRKLDALTGHSPNQFIRMVRLQKAKELLADPDISIATIALECGYNDPGYFARVFKQETGKTPLEWKGGH
jgi:signal transduction histidine kinase/CheY-like chemotaxis protein/ligand-binding sensor domain-containing protein/AraC-like DNA-binding protein